MAEYLRGDKELFRQGDPCIICKHRRGKRIKCRTCVPNDATWYEWNGGLTDEV